jgi:hypothetical protein
MHEVYSKPQNRLAHRESWRVLVQAWRQSGLTAKVFCAQKGLKEDDLRRWSSRLKQTQSPALSPKKPVTITTSSPTLIPVTLTSQGSAVAAEEYALELMLGKNLLIRVKKQFDEDLLLQLIQALKRANLC